jgi:hypothetical protein
MTDAKTDYPFPQKGARAAPDKREMRIFVQSAIHEGGSKEMPAPAARFARRFSATVSHYPEQRDLPNWLRALIEKKVSTEELAQTLHDRLLRAPSEENQELALIVANEIARMKGGPEALAKHVVPELLAKLSGNGGQPQ